MNSNSIGQFLPASYASHKSRAKALSTTTGCKLMAAQEALSRLDGFSGMHEIQERFKAHVIPGPFSDDVMPHRVAIHRPSWDLVEHREDALMRSSRALNRTDHPKDVGLPSMLDPFDFTFLALGLFDTEQTHEQMLEAYEDARAVTIDARFSRATRLSDYADLHAGRLTPLGQALIADLYEFVEAEDFVQLHALALKLPELPWPAAAALAMLNSTGAFEWRQATGLEEAAEFAWRVRHLFRMTARGLRNLSRSIGTGVEPVDELAAFHQQAFDAGGRMFSAMGRHGDAAALFERAYRRDQARGEAPMSPIDLRAVSALNADLPDARFYVDDDVHDLANRGGMDLPTSLMRALRYYQRAGYTQRPGMRERFLELGDLRLLDAMYVSRYLVVALNFAPPPAYSRDELTIAHHVALELVSRVEPFLDAHPWVRGRILALLGNPATLSAHEGFHRAHAQPESQEGSRLERALLQLDSFAPVNVPGPPEIGVRMLNADALYRRQLIEEGMRAFEEGHPYTGGWAGLDDKVRHSGSLLAANRGELTVLDLCYVENGAELFQRWYERFDHDGLSDQARADAALDVVTYLVYEDPDLVAQAREAHYLLDFDEEG